MNDLMIDLETLGTHTKAPIISIGAVFFDIEKKELGPTFYGVLDVADQIDSKIRFADASTIKWWMSQSGAAKRVFKDNAHPTAPSLETFADWILNTVGSKSKSTKKVTVWGNGSGFDITLMETMFEDYKIKCPWMYYKVNDLRTFKRFVAKGEAVQKLEGTDHNALDDAVNQANYVLKYV